MIGCADSIERIPWLGFRYDRWLERSPVESWEAYTRQTGQLGADWEDNLQDCSIRELASLQSLSTVGIWEVLLSRRFHTGLFLSGFCPGATFSTEIVPTLLLELHQIGNLNQSSRETNLVRRSIIWYSAQLGPLSVLACCPENSTPDCVVDGSSARDDDVPYLN
jgi:hypothetical protein